jgi:hypothetical protein
MASSCRRTRCRWSGPAPMPSRTNVATRSGWQAARMSPNQTLHLIEAA